MTNGWIKLHRKIEESSVWLHSPEVYMVWCWCLIRANHKESKVPFKQGDIILKPGEFVTSRASAVEEMPLSHRQWRTSVTYLKSTNRIAIETTSRYTKIRVVKWDEYQIEGDETTSQTTSLTTSQRPASDQPATTDKNVKNVKNDKKTTYSAFVKPTADDLKAYAQSIGYKLNAESFLAYYEANGWMVGRNHMKSWQAAMRTWKIRDAGAHNDDHPGQKWNPEGKYWYTPISPVEKTYFEKGDNDAKTILESIGLKVKPA
jgi:hypothetical protein